MRVEYISNNSGGKWWLTDEDWKALESAGWAVHWFSDPQYQTLPLMVKSGRFLGALATEAVREGVSLQDAVDEWERVTGKSSTDAGCPCCGQPHLFTEYDDNDKLVRIGPNAEYVASW